MTTRQSTTTRRRGRQVPQRSRRTFFVLAFLGFLVVMIIGSVALLGRNATDQRATAAAANAGQVAVTDRPVPPNAEPNGRAWGPKDAPIQVIEYADYECEACGLFATSYEEEFVAAFAHTGKVRFEIRNAPFHGENARNAAEAAYCAVEQDTFWPMHDSLFLNQPIQEGAPAFSDAQLNAIAGKLGMDTAAFGQCMSSNTYAQQVEADYQATVASNINRTPTFVINGTAYPGVLSADEFRQIFAQIAPDVTFN